MVIIGYSDGHKIIITDWMTPLHNCISRFLYSLSVHTKTDIISRKPGLTISDIIARITGTWLTQIVRTSEHSDVLTICVNPVPVINCTLTSGSGSSDLLLNKSLDPEIVYNWTSQYCCSWVWWKCGGIQKVYSKSCTNVVNGSRYWKGFIVWLCTNFNLLLMLKCSALVAYSRQEFLTFKWIELEGYEPKFKVSTPVT